jgi:iron complex outermembrane receptor protein
MAAYSNQDGNGSSLGLPGINNAYQSIHHANLSGRVIGQFDFTNNVMAYVSAARGYKGPGFNTGFNVNAPTVLPEIPTSYEVGMKSSFLQQRLTFNISAYSETFKDLQVQSYDVAAVSYLITNAGSLASRGFEATLAALPLPSLKIIAGLSYVDAFFKSFQLDQCYAGQPGCSAQGTTNSTGNRLPDAPRWTGTLQLDYHHRVSTNLEVTANVAEYARSWVNFASNADPHTVQAAYALSNATLGIGRSDGSWRISAFCRNCADRRFVTYIEANPLSAADYGQQFGLDSFRYLGVSVDFRY